MTNAVRERGAAMVELAVCLFPYCILLLGVVLLGQLALGKQEVFKSIAWAGSKPNVQSVSDAEKFFFPGTFADGASLTDTTPYEPDADADTEEPVLPYAQSDISAAITRGSVNISHTTRIENGEVVVEVNVTKTSSGTVLESLGVVDLSSTTGKTEVDASDLADLEYNFTVNGEVAQEIANTLGEWVGYSRATGGYKYQLENQELMPGEEDTTEAQRFREEFAIGGDADSEDNSFSFESVSPGEDGFRGYHVTDTVDMDEFASQNYQSDDSAMPTVEPENATLQQDYIQTGDAAESCWDIYYMP